MALESLFFSQREEFFMIEMVNAFALGFTQIFTGTAFGLMILGIVDGHPMAKKGEAGRALGAVLMSSLVGAIFGAFALALAIPIVRPLVLTFGSPEFFMLSVLGITLVTSLS